VSALAPMVEQDSEQWTTVDHLQTISRDVQRRLAVALAESGHHSLRPSFGPLLERLHEGALPVGQVAAAINVSPQAASRAALVLEGFGYVARVASTVDGRSRVVALTSRGQDLIARAGETFAECEHAYEEILGRALINRIRRALDRLRTELELALKPDSTVLIRPTHSIGSVILISLWAKREIVTSVNQSGHHGVRRSHIELLSTLRTRDVRMSDIARELGVTRQAVSATVQELEGLCYVERRPDSTDRRAVLIAPSVEGSELLDKVEGASREFEALVLDALGNSRWSRFVRDMAQLAAAVSAGHGPVSPPAFERPISPDQSTDLESLAEGLRSQLGARQAARLGALLTTGQTRSAENGSHPRAEKVPRR
jgi:DNA-binding MarR family transcriptional regulator